jgi:RimJ/RimL family protein N-acetyltransferase
VRRDVQLRDGERIEVRPIAVSDARGIVELHGRLSDRARYMRFFSTYPRISPADLRRFVTVDHHDREALVALVDGAIVAVGRYERLAPDGDDAEVAFVVDDAHQRRGIAPILLGGLVEAGRAVGLRRFVAEVLPANTSMIKMFSSSGYAPTFEYGNGVVHVSFAI